jgi:hypothetical protein
MIGMSGPFEKLLLDPAEADLVAALEKASRRGAREQPGAAAWRPLLREVAENAEGRTQLEALTPGADADDPFARRRAARYVCAAWWSDHQGRKHVRVAGGDTASVDPHLHHTRMDHDERPPLWHVCPGRVYRVKRGGREPQWLASCACGETGPPRALGWMGECCGPCHDRREEGLAAAEGPVSLIRVVGPVFGLAFSPDGDRLAVSSAYGTVGMHDLGTGIQTLLHASPDEPDGFRPLLYSPDGTLLAAGDPGPALVRVWDIEGEGDPHEGDLIDGGGLAPASGLAFYPFGGVLAACNSGWLNVWKRGAAGWRTAQVQGLHASSLSFAPDGRTLAVGSGRGEGLLLGTADWSMRSTVTFGAPPGSGVHYLEHTPDGRALVMLTGPDEADPDRRSWQLRRYDLARQREERQTPVHPPSAVALTPDGRYLARVHHGQKHSPAVVYFWDLERWQEAGWLEWSPEDDLRALDFSPDGRTLATGSAAGVVKLWPWRALLEG